MTVRISLVLALVVALTPALAQTLPHTGQMSALTHRQRPQGFTDYALGKINPNNTEFGRSYQAARAGLVRWTIDDLYFWSNCVTLSLLTVVTGFCFLHLRGADKKQRIAAALIAHMWNGRVSDKIEIERRTERYNALADVHNALVEKSLNAVPLPRRRTAAVEKEELPENDTTNEVDAGVAEEQSVSVAAAVNGTSVRETNNSSAALRQQSRRPATAPARLLGLADANASGSVAAGPDGPVEAPFARDQEVRRLRSQVQALQNRESNLLVRLNAYEEFKKQDATDSGTTTK